MDDRNINLAYFITAHGFGHASRSCAVINKMSQYNPDYYFHIFTNLPEWFLFESLNNKFSYIPIKSDVGLVQESPFRENIHETINELKDFIPFIRSKYDQICDYIVNTKCKLILCDISPLGIFLGKILNISSVLIENFTWDWIYEPYKNSDPNFLQSINYYKSIYKQQNYHIQTEPICNQSYNIDLLAPPISRIPKTNYSLIRNRLGIKKNKKMILITMGGVPSSVAIPDDLQDNEAFTFVVPCNTKTIKSINNIIYLPHHSNYYHPDLINACDAVITKLGYSTIAEAYHAKVPMGYITRPRFRESKILEDFVKKNMSGDEIKLNNGILNLNLYMLESLLNKNISNNHVSNGSEEIANFLTNLLD